MTMQVEQKEWVHPEIKSGEVLLRNMTQAEFNRLDFSTKRQGQIAYDGEGNRLRHNDWMPVFLQLPELDDRGIDLQSARKMTR